MYDGNSRKIDFFQIKEFSIYVFLVIFSLSIQNSDKIVSKAYDYASDKTKVNKFKTAMNVLFKNTNDVLIEF